MTNGRYNARYAPVTYIPFYPPHLVKGLNNVSPSAQLLLHITNI